MLFIENVKLALTAIRSNKMRAFLTMLGIIIGISSVIAITSIGDSAKAVVGKEFNSFGKNYLIIYLNWSMTPDYTELSDYISHDDIEALKMRFPNDILYIAPTANASSEVTVGRTKGKLQIEGIAGQYSQFKAMNILYGRIVNDADVKAGREVTVLSKEAALHFFNKENAVGEQITVTVNGEPKDLTVIGVYEVEKSLFSGMDGGDTFSAYAPYSILETPDRTTGQLNVYVASNGDFQTIGQKMADYLAKIKDKPQGYYLTESVESQQGMINNMLGTLSLAIGAIAAISLLVGGIGIMNIMLVSVTERTREIGIRKSLGARTRDILQQFLVESMIISAIGGLIGTLLGMGVAAIGMKFANVDFVMNPLVILMAVGFSAVVGMFFGLYPAKKAAKLDPIEALRYE